MEAGLYVDTSPLQGDERFSIRFDDFSISLAEQLAATAHLYADADPINRRIPLAASPKNVGRPHVSPTTPPSRPPPSAFPARPHAYANRLPGQIERAPTAGHPNGDTAYTAGPLGVTATVHARGRSGVTRDPAAMIVALRQPDGRRSYPLADALGSIVALTDAASGQAANPLRLRPASRAWKIPPEF